MLVRIEWMIPVRIVAFSLTFLIASMGWADTFKPSKADQVKLGKQASKEVRQKYKVLPSNDERVKVMRRAASRILATFDDGKEPWDYTFDVIDSKDVNAFALPGGPTFFFTGLLNRMKTEDELAAVLAHELVHVRREHWAYQYADSQKRNLGLSLILILARANRSIVDLASIGNSLYDLQFSRGHETQADEQGMDALVAAGYNPQGMVDVFTMLRETSKGGRPPEFLSSHPDDGNRIKHIEQRAASLGRVFPPQRPLPWSSGTYSSVRAGLRWNW